MHRALPTTSLVLALGLLCLVPPSSSPAAASPDEDAWMLRTLRTHWVNALNSGDVDSLMEDFADGAVVSLTYVPTLVGDETIRAFFDALTASNAVSIHYTSGGIDIDGDWAYERWSALVTLTPIRDGRERLAERHLFSDTGIRIYRRLSDGSWRIDREAWNGKHRHGDYLASIARRGKIFGP